MCGWPGGEPAAPQLAWSGRHQMASTMRPGSSRRSSTCGQAQVRMENLGAAGRLPPPQGPRARCDDQRCLPHQAEDWDEVRYEVQRAERVGESQDRQHLGIPRRPGVLRTSERGVPQCKHRPVPTASAPAPEAKRNCICASRVACRAFDQRRPPPPRRDLRSAARPSLHPLLHHCLAPHSANALSYYAHAWRSTGPEPRA